jgi:ribosomal protein S3AE
MQSARKNKKRIIEKVKEEIEKKAKKIKKIKKVEVRRPKKLTKIK